MYAWRRNEHHARLSVLQVHPFFASCVESFERGKVDILFILIVSLSMLRIGNVEFVIAYI